MVEITHVTEIGARLREDLMALKNSPVANFLRIDFMLSENQQHTIENPTSMEVQNVVAFEKSEIAELFCVDKFFFLQVVVGSNATTSGYTS